MIPHPQEMDKLKEQEMPKNRPVVKNKLNEWYDWLVDYVSKPPKRAGNKAFLKVQYTVPV